MEERSRFERARIISARALQIAMGAPVLTDKAGEKDPIKLARKEFEADVVPLTVRCKEPPKLED
ncbi:DNA-directed RNA polymerase subunit K [candidate division MSBL1 archaeon SCGC-AAA382A20]|uniref:DNA-directed RNA polymerase subunit K n=1 Tax=candidate division MSBL1 archaeon SCGC-AAA382A20 TaxID=1698280 RepID=A0A133VK67_9EURY|nr:DNA-directed RNA polymerase subunit K [candidate division MSBL1 archaeon SCGC-AAA382A20]